MGGVRDPRDPLFVGGLPDSDNSPPTSLLGRSHVGGGALLFPTWGFGVCHPLAGLWSGGHFHCHPLFYEFLRGNPTSLVLGGEFLFP